MFLRGGGDKHSHLQQETRGLQHLKQMMQVDVYLLGQDKKRTSQLNSSNRVTILGYVMMINILQCSSSVDGTAQFNLDHWTKVKSDSTVGFLAMVITFGMPIWTR